MIAITIITMMMMMIIIIKNKILMRYALVEVALEKYFF